MLEFASFFLHKVKTGETCKNRSLRYKVYIHFHEKKTVRSVHDNLDICQILSVFSCYQFFHIALDEYHSWGLALLKFNRHWAGMVTIHLIMLIKSYLKCSLNVVRGCILHKMYKYANQANHSLIHWVIKAIEIDAIDNLILFTVIHNI